MKKVSEIRKKICEPISNKYFINNKYVNRELSWLYFNQRCLYQTMRKDIPFNERCNFLQITSSNLDEFIAVRFSSVLNKMLSNTDIVDISGMNPTTEYFSILESIKTFKDLQNSCYGKLTSKLQKKFNVKLYKFDDLSKDEKSYIGKIFYNKIFPVIVPMNYDTTKEFPEILSGQLSIVVSIEDIHMTNFQVISFIPLDNSLDKVYQIPSKSSLKFISLEEIIYGFLPKIYFGKKIKEYGMIKIIRKGDIELNHNEDIYIADRMRQTLLNRKYSQPVFMDVTSNISKDFQKLLLKIFDLDKDNIYINKHSFNYNALTNIHLVDESYKKFDPQYPNELLGIHDMFTAIDKSDILLHHPYESYDPVIKFIEHAATDKDVVSIKQTLYRVSSIDSPIVNALCLASENGKNVTVMLEIKARFDEDRNLSMINKLKSSGVKLIYGTEHLKTHCKFVVVIRRHKDKFKIYSHLATGNYNDKTSKIYTDISYFTSSYKIGQDLCSIFNMLSGFSEPNDNIDKLYFAPYNLRKKLMSSIDNEIKNVKNGKSGIISIKVNSISDKDIIDKLYEASRIGVRITIFCRGICSIKPINNNIVIRSIVGRFLEHSRIFYFFNNDNPNIYISSSDLLTRNLDKRFELLIPVKSEYVKYKLIKILSMYYKDTFNTFEMNRKGVYLKLDGDMNIHDKFMEDAIKSYKLKTIPKMVKLNKKKWEL